MGEGGAAPGQSGGGGPVRSGGWSRSQRQSSLSGGHDIKCFRTIFFFLNTLESLAGGKVMKSINCTNRSQ